MLLITECIEKMKSNSFGTWNGMKINDSESRDQILYGNSDQECTGIVVTCFASIEVIKMAGELGCNLIIVHESLFWNHGDHTDWLENNSTFQTKKQLLDKYKICVWRNHDYIHSGIKVEGKYKDGIFYGISSLLGWNNYISDKNAQSPQMFEIPEIKVEDLTIHLKSKFNLTNLRFIGNKSTKIRKVLIPLHIMGRGNDAEIIKMINDSEIDCILALEMVDFTVNEYLRDSGMANENKCGYIIGHFNMEELGMEFYSNYLRENWFKDTNIKFIQSGDVYTYL